MCYPNVASMFSISNTCDVTGENTSFGMGQNSVCNHFKCPIWLFMSLPFCILCITYMLLNFDALCLLKC